MRELEFRGMNINCDWYYGNLSLLKYTVSGYVKPGYYISNKVGMPFAHLVRPETVGQYSGCKDKNNKKIYEHDILKVMVWFGDTFSYCNLPCVFKDGMFGYELYSGSGDYEVMQLDGSEEVIGDKFKNPELLKENQPCQ